MTTMCWVRCRCRVPQECCPRCAGTSPREGVSGCFTATSIVRVLVHFVPVSPVDDDGSCYMIYGAAYYLSIEKLTAGE